LEKLKKSQKAINKTTRKQASVTNKWKK